MSSLLKVRGWSKLFNRAWGHCKVIDSRHILRKNLHELPEDWEWKWFTDVMDVDGGTQPPASTFSSVPKPGYVRLVQIRDFETDSHETYIPDSPKWRKCDVADVLIGRYGAALGRICRGLQGAYNVALAKVVPTDLVSIDYAYHLLRSQYFQAPLLASGGRSAQAGFNKAGLSVIPLPIPPLREQHAIAHILGSIDNKIDINCHMNETLEAIVRALFTDWFVDFGPLKAKMEGRELFGLSAEIAALFPTALDAEGKPEGWVTLALSEVTSYLNRGLSPKYIDNGGVLVLNQKCIRDDTVDTSKGRRHDQSQKKIDGRELRLGDILVNSTGVGTLGRVAQILYLPEKTIVDSHVTVVRASSLVTSNFLGLNLLRRQSEIESLGEGSTGQTELNRGKLGQLRILVPQSTDILHQFDRLTMPFRDQVTANLRENETLTELHDLLLPKLLSGGLRVKDTNQMLGDTDTL